MKRRNSILCGTALILGLTLISGSVWAESTEIMVSGMHTTTTIDPGVNFTDAEGITHYRGLVDIVEVEGQDLDGVSVTGLGHYVYNINIDLATGNGDINIEMSLEMTYGDLVGAWRGRADLTVTGFVFAGPFNYARGNGDFKRWHFRGDATGIFGVPTAQWEGIFHIPGGGGGDKEFETESQTWSNLKALYR